MTSTKKKVEYTEKESDPPPSPQITSAIHKHSVGLGVGQTFLYSDFQKIGNNQMTVDFFYNYTASYSFDFNANLHFSNHKSQEESLQILGLAFGIKGKFFQFDSFSPYIVGGLGTYLPTSKQNLNGIITDSKSEFTLGYHMGVGGELQLNKNANIGLLSQFHNPFDVEQDNGISQEGSYLKVMMTFYYIFQ